jgi:Flp pilus assembly protein TadG
MRMYTRRRQPLGVGRETGLATLEMAFIFPIFLFLTLGLVEFSRAWLTVNTLNHVTRELVRVAAVTSPPSAINAAVESRKSALLEANFLVDGASPEVTCTPACDSPSDVTVTTTLSFEYLGVTGTILGFTGFTGEAFDLISTATMRYER